MNAGNFIPSAQWIAKKKDRIPMPLRKIEKQSTTGANSDGKNEESTNSTPRDLKTSFEINSSYETQQSRVNVIPQPDDSRNNYTYRDTGRSQVNTHHNSSSLQRESNYPQNYYQDNSSRQSPYETRGGTCSDSDRYSWNSSSNGEKYTGSRQDQTRDNRQQEKPLPQPDDSRNKYTYRDTERSQVNAHQNGYPPCRESDYRQNYYQNVNSERQSSHETRDGTRSDSHRYSRNSSPNGEKYTGSRQDQTRDNRQQEKPLPQPDYSRNRYTYRDTERSQVNSHHNGYPLQRECNYPQNYYQDNSSRQSPYETRGGTCSDSHRYSRNSSPNGEKYTGSRQYQTRDNGLQERRLFDYADDRSRFSSHTNIAKSSSRSEKSESHRQQTGPTSCASYERQTGKIDDTNWQKCSTPNRNVYHGGSSGDDRTNSNSKPDISEAHRQQTGSTSCASYDRQTGKFDNWNWGKSTTPNQNGYNSYSSGNREPLQQSVQAPPRKPKLKRLPGDERFEGQLQVIESMLADEDVPSRRPDSNERPRRNRSYSPPYGLEILMELDELENAAKAAEAAKNDHAAKPFHQCTIATQTNLVQVNAHLANSKLANTSTLDNKNTYLFDRSTLISMRELTVSQSIRTSEIEKSLGELGKSQPRNIVPRKPKEEQLSETASRVMPTGSLIDASKELVKNNAALHQDIHSIKKDCNDMPFESKPVEHKPESSSISNLGSSKHHVGIKRDSTVRVNRCGQAANAYNAEWPSLDSAAGRAIVEPEKTVVLSEKEYTRLKANSDSADKLRKQIQLAMNETSTLKTQRDEFEEAFEKAQKELQSKTEALETTKKENDMIKKENDMVRKEIDIIKKENDVTKQENDSIKKELKEKEEYIDELLKQIDDTSFGINEARCNEDKTNTNASLSSASPDGGPTLEVVSNVQEVENQN